MFYYFEKKINSDSNKVQNCIVFNIETGNCIFFLIISRKHIGIYLRFHLHKKKNFGLSDSWNFFFVLVVVQLIDNQHCNDNNGHNSSNTSNTSESSSSPSLCPTPPYNIDLSSSHENLNTSFNANHITSKTSNSLQLPNRKCKQVSVTLDLIKFFFSEICRCFKKSF